MTSYEPGAVVVAAFPFTDNAQPKPRPVVIISTAAFNQHHGHCLALMITTATHTRWPSDMPISDLAACGLPTPSVVRMKCFTLDNSLITKRIGHMQAQDWASVQNTLHHSIAVS